MSWTKRILMGVGALALLALGTLAIALSYESSCVVGQQPPNEARTMKVAVHRCYGSPQVIALEDVAIPELEADQVLVKVRAIGLNPIEWHKVRGEPYFLRLSAGLGTPKQPRLGADFAGTVAAVGATVTRFKPGDEVFGRWSTAMAQYAVVREDGPVVAKPANLAFEQAAAVPVAAVTALQALRDRGQLQPGQSVLINGASGGVGTFAVQIAKTMGAEVTGVCSTRNVGLVRSLGADHVIDYTQDDFTQTDRRYDVILDNVGSQSIPSMRRLLKPGGHIVIVGSASKDPWIGPMTGMISAALLSIFVDEDIGLMIARMNAADLTQLSEWMRQGKVQSVIDRRYPFAEIAAAMAYLEEGRTRGKIVLMMEE